MPAEVTARHRSNLFFPLQISDLIGVKDRHYLDHTGLQQHRSIADLMRHAALNQGADDLASYDGFVPADFHYSTKRPEPDDPIAVGGRYSDDQLYALAMYLYALEPPPNPNKFDAVAAHAEITRRLTPRSSWYRKSKLRLADDTPAAKTRVQTVHAPPFRPRPRGHAPNRHHSLGGL